MLQDDYEKIMEHFKQTIEGQPLNLQDLCEESLSFFQKIQTMVQTGSDTEKEEALNTMSGMYQTLMSETKKLTDNTGFTEEQLMAFAENSNNFDSEQWKLIQKTRATMSETGDSLAAYVKEVYQAIEPKKQKSPILKKKKKIGKPNKDSWLRS